MEKTSVLLVEDDPLIRAVLTEMLTDMGHTVMGTGDLKEGLALAEKADFDIAVLNFWLNDECTEELGHIIQRRGLPFILATGSDAAGLPTAFRGRPVLEKPFQFEQLSNMIASLVARTGPKAKPRGPEKSALTQGS